MNFSRRILRLPLLNLFIKKALNSPGAILTLHRVDKFDDNRLWLNEHLKITPDFLDNLILKFKKDSYAFISIDELFEILIRKKSIRKVISFTLDDGYRDNFENAFPVFLKYNVPFTIYLSTSIIEKKFIYWWLLLEDIILENELVELSDGVSYPCNNMIEKENSFLKIREKILKIAPLKFSEAFCNLFALYDVNLAKYNDSLPLTWDQLRELEKCPLVTLGCHTHDHFPLMMMSKDDIINDINKSKKLFKENLEKPVEHFCYPYGDGFAITENEIKIISELGFKTAVTTNNSYLLKNNSKNLFSLPRIFIYENESFDIYKNMYLDSLRNNFRNIWDQL
ncbi:MAG: polysaccharide deacetylase family protein [Bacteroidales bacterium]|nr:polysaccharide deacetylase family protein [Bacteroidales bacterium]